MKAKISVLVTSYNIENYIDDCISSIIEQTYQNIEIIVVDDGSTDHTLDHIKCFAQSDNRIKIVESEHHGVSVARNKCLSVMTGDYFIFVDGDDYILPQTCEILFSKAFSADADITFAPMIKFNEDSAFVFGDRTAAFVSDERLSGKICFQKMLLAGCAYPMVCGNLYNSTYVKNHRLEFMGEFHEDEYFLFTSLMYAQSVTYITENCYYYRQRNGSIMHEVDNLKKRSISLSFIAKILEQFAKLNLRDEDGLMTDLVHRHLRNLRKSAQNLFVEYMLTSKKRCILIIAQSPYSCQYGVATYINSVIEALDSELDDIILVYLDAPQFSFEMAKDFATLYFPRLKKNIDEELLKLYDMSVFYRLAVAIGDHKSVICHFNTYEHIELMRLFRSKFSARIIFTVHYTSWGLNLRGNKKGMERLLGKPADSISSRGNKLVLTYMKEKAVLGISDIIIAPSKYTVNHLKDLYGIQDSNIRYIPHMIQPMINKEVDVCLLKERYGFSREDILMLFIGRLDENKGIYNLIDAFKRIAPDYANLYLVIVGNGAFGDILPCCNPLWKRIIFIGHASHMLLSDLIFISDIGVVPSYYEEFGYTAREMLSGGLSVVCSKTSGLSQLENSSSDITMFEHDSENQNLINCLKSLLMKKKSSINTLKTVNSSLNKHSDFVVKIRALFR